MRFATCVRRYIERLGPYPSLFLLAVPLAIIEPLKLVAVVIFGSGHWVTGTLVMLGSYALGLFFVERLFKFVKPKLLTLPWFALAWTWFVAVRDKACRWLLAPWSLIWRPKSSRVGARRPGSR
jgi:uncharacterized membrane protein